MERNEKDMLIKAKKEEIKKLQNEINELSKRNLFQMVTEKPIEHVCYSKGKERPYLVCSDSYSTTWQYIRALSTKIHFNEITWLSYSGDSFADSRDSKFSHFSEAEKELSAEFASEVIKLYNQYVKIANPTFEFDGKTIDVWGDE